MTQHQCLKCHATVELPDGHTLNVCPQCGAVQAKVAAAVRKVAPSPTPVVVTPATPPSAPPVAPASVQPPAKAIDEKFCADCGSVIKLKAEICPKCGVRQMPPTHNANANLLTGEDRPGAFVAKSVSVAPKRSAMWAVVGAIAVLGTLGSVMSRHEELKANAVVPNEPVSAPKAASRINGPDEFSTAVTICGVMKQMDGIIRCETSGSRVMSVLVHADKPQTMCDGIVETANGFLPTRNAPALKNWRLEIVSPFSNGTPVARCSF